MCDLSGFNLKRFDHLDSTRFFTLCTNPTCTTITIFFVCSGIDGLMGQPLSLLLIYTVTYVGFLTNILYVTARGLKNVVFKKVLQILF